VPKFVPDSGGAGAASRGWPGSGAMIEGVGPRPAVALPDPVLPGAQPDEELVEGPVAGGIKPLPTVPAAPGAIGTPPGPMVWRGILAPDAPGAIRVPPGPTVPPGATVPGTAVPVDTPGVEAPGDVPVAPTDDPEPADWVRADCDIKARSPAVSTTACHA
jgi:hypothetical protein